MVSTKQLDEAYMEIAIVMSRLSSAKRLQVGAILVKDKQIIAEGYNGTPTGFSNSCEFTDCLGYETTKKEVIHAEQNALCKVARSTSSSIGSTLYVTANPCADCAKNIIQCGIVKVVYKDLYTTDSGYGLGLLEQAGIEIVKLKEVNP